MNWETPPDGRAGVADPDERVRAQELEDFYRIAFSHPAVEGVIMWGFRQNSQWRKNCYIVNADWSLNEAGRRYEALRAEWTTEATGVTNADGTFTFRGFHGTYELTVVPTVRAPATNIITLSPGKNPAAFTVTLK